MSSVDHIEESPSPIYLVDDDALFRGALREVLTGNGYRVRDFDSGEAAVQAASREVPRLVLIDVKLPGIDGFAACEQILARAGTNRIPVVFCSAVRTDIQAQLKAFEAGGVALVPKPVDLSQLLLRIRRLLALSDVSREVQEMELLRQTADRIVDAMPAMLFVVRPDLTVLSLNRAASQFLGRREEVIGRSLAATLEVGREVTEWLAQAVGAATREALSSNRQAVPLRLEAWEDVRYVDLRVSPLWGQRDDEDRVLVFGNDVTEAVVSASRHQELQERLRHVDRLASMGQLAASISHELSNPLSFVMSNLTYLQNELKPLFASATGSPVSEEVPGALADATEAARRMYTILGTLRTLIRTPRSELSPCRVGEAVEQLLAIARGYARVHRVELGAEVDPELTFYGTSADLLQVLLNLVTNAVQAIGPSRDDGRVTIRARRQDGRVVVSVTDNGPGFERGSEKQIFEPFYTTKADQGGTGLGLSISRELVQAMQGTITASNNEEGARIVIELPDGPPQVAARAKILIVDDEPAAIRVLRRMIGRHCDIIEATSVAEAMRRLDDEGSVDFILSDVVMPESGGDKLLEEVFARHPDLGNRIFFYTAWEASPLVQRIRSAVPGRVFSKPLAPETLEKILGIKLGPSTP